MGNEINQVHKIGLKDYIYWVIMILSIIVVYVGKDHETQQLKTTIEQQDITIEEQVTNIEEIHSETTTIQNQSFYFNLPKQVQIYIDNVEEATRPGTTLSFPKE